MTKSPTIVKFGGTSVGDAEAIRRAASIVVHQANDRPIVVVSALSHVTDALVRSAKLAVEGEPERAITALEEQFERHRNLARNLLGVNSQKFSDEVDRIGSEAARLIRMSASEPDRRSPIEDELLSYGERLSAQLFTAVLRTMDSPARLIDARKCMVTDEEHGRASPLLGETERRTRQELQPLLESSEIPVLGGFIGSTLKGVTTTLGRGGSDYTASLIGALLSAREIQIWTDVPGILTADPRLVPSARSISRLSYAEAAELAYFGAKVLHPKSVQPAVERSIPIRICDSRTPEQPGTVVWNHLEKASSAVKAIACKRGITTLRISSAGMLGAYGFLKALFEVFDRHRVVVDVVATSEVSVSLTIDDPTALPALLPDLESLGAVEVEHGRAIVCVVGEGLQHTPGVASRVFGAIRDINVFLISQGASSINLTFIVDEAHAGEVVSRLHEAVFGE
ncbi:MAG: lysine-sensitive aspartokinase 3 [Acidobacteria bacterium]|nr:lysine-sensitive aspartokinase 3 [Acidobacteriota bacterium]